MVLTDFIPCLLLVTGKQMTALQKYSKDYKVEKYIVLLK